MSIASDELHFCWYSGASGAPTAWIRLKMTTGTNMYTRILQLDNSVNKKVPELASFDPEYGSATITDQDNLLKFNFFPQAVYPAKNGATYGMLKIFRGAIMPDGTPVRTD